MKITIYCSGAKHLKLNAHKDAFTQEPEKVRELHPAYLGFGSFHIEGLSDGLVRYGWLQNEYPRVQRRLGSRRADLFRSSIEMVSVHKDGGKGGLHEARHVAVS